MNTKDTWPAGVVTFHIGREIARELTSASFSGCGRYMALVRRNMLPLVVELDTYTQVKLPLKLPALAVAFRPSLPEIAFASGERGDQIERFDLHYPQLRMSPVWIDKATCARYSPDGQFLAAGTAIGGLVVWNVGITIPGWKPECVHSRLLFDKCVNTLAFTCQHEQILLSPAGGGPFFFNLAKGGLSACLVRKDGGRFDWDCLSVDSHPAYGRSAFGGIGQHVFLLNHAMGEVVVLQSRFEVVRQVAFIASAMRLAVVGDAGIELWSTTADLRLVDVWEPPAGRVHGVTPVGEQLFVAWG